MRIWSLGRRRAIALGAATVLGALALPASASAGTVSISGSNLNYAAAAGEENDLTIETDGSVFRMIDTTAPLTAGTGCSQRSTHRVNCPTAGITVVAAVARDGDDSVQALIGTVDANLNGGTGADTLTSDAGDDTLTLGRSGLSGELASAGAGADTLRGPTDSNGSAQLLAGAGDDHLVGGPGFESMFGDEGSDDIHGGGGSSDNAFWSGTKAVDISLDDVANDGASGEDDNVHSDVESISGTSFGDTLTGSTGDEQFYGGGGKDTIQAGPGDDTLSGGDGADTLAGEGGDDFVQGGNNPDVMSGGTGADTVSYDDHFANQVTVTVNNVANDGSGGGAEGDNVRTDVENLRGGPNNDTLTGSILANRIEGQAGDDTIIGLGGDDTLFGDFTFGSAIPGDDTLNGGNGDDDLAGGGGGDHMIGSNGYDFVTYQSFAGSNPLTVTANNVANDGEAGEGDNVDSSVEGIVGADGNDNLTGSSGPSTLRGLGGTDTLNGAGGNDMLIGDRCCTYVADVFNGGDGDDTVSYSEHFSGGVTVDIDGVADDGAGGAAEGDNVQTTVENVIGSQSNDSITGNNANNVLSGKGGSDMLFGGGGGDTLAGGGSFDTLEGQAGKDELNSRGDGATDTDNCGTEADTVIADSFDTVNADCETVIP